MSNGTGLPDIQQWQTARVIRGTTEDAPLTDYKPADLDATTKLKMIAIAPATAIAMRAFGTNASNDTAKMIISGWMNIGKGIGGEPGPGPGHRLCDLTLTLGSKSISSFQPLADNKWGAAATWFEVDTYVVVDDAVGITFLDSTLSNHAANRENCILIPTLGYTHLLIEFVDKGGATTEMTDVGVMWRAIRMREIVLGFAG